MSQDDRRNRGPYANIIPVEEYRRQANLMADLNRRIRAIELRLSQLGSGVTAAVSSIKTPSSSPATVDHGNTFGLGDDDHPQYAEIASAESITGVWTFGAVKVYLANGTTYYLDDDGDAKFKDIAATSLIATTGTISQVGANATITVDNRTITSTDYLVLQAGGSSKSMYCDLGGFFRIRDQDDSVAERLKIDSSDGRFDVFGGFGAIDVYFANGTIYKVEADGDAFFKNLTLGANSGVASSSGFLALSTTANNNMYFQCGLDWIYRDVDAGFATRLQIASNDGRFDVFGGFGAIDVTFGNGTTYKIFADGGAKFLDLISGISKFGDGGVTNYANFAADGTLTLLGTAKVTKKIILANSILERGASAPTLVYIDNFIAWSYGINDDSVLTWAVPDDWDSTVGIIVEASWYIDEDYGGGDDQEVKWQCAYSCVPHDESELIDAPTHTGILTGPVQNIPTNAKELTTTHIGTIPAGSIAAGDEIGLTFKRIAADGDDPSAEPVVIHLELEYTANKLGA